MKNSFWLVVAIVFGPTLLSISAPVFAAEGDHAFEISAFGGLATTGADDDALGVGGGMFLGFPVGDNYTLGVQGTLTSIGFQPPSDSFEQVLSHGGGQTLTEISLLCKKRFGGGPAHFLLEAGAGAAFYNNNSSGTEVVGGISSTFAHNISQTYPMVVGMIGLEVPLSGQWSVFGQFGMDAYFMPGNSQEYIPLQGGLSYFP